MERQKDNPGVEAVAVMPPLKPKSRHPDDPGFTMPSNFGFGNKAVQHQYHQISGRSFTTIRNHDGECLLIRREGNEVITIPTGMDYALADRIERLIGRFWK